MKPYYTLIIFLLLSSCMREHELPAPEATKSEEQSIYRNPITSFCYVGTWNEDVTPGLSGSYSTFKITFDSIYIKTNYWGDVGHCVKYTSSTTSNGYTIVTCDSMAIATDTYCSKGTCHFKDGILTVKTRSTDANYSYNSSEEKTYKYHYELDNSNGCCRKLILDNKRVFKKEPIVFTDISINDIPVTY